MGDIVKLIVENTTWKRCIYCDRNVYTWVSDDLVDCGVCRLEPPKITTATKWGSMRKKIAPEVKKRDNYTCQNCGSKSNLTIDHIVPLSKGGTNDLTNFQTLCRPCNSSKGNRAHE